MDIKKINPKAMLRVTLDDAPSIARLQYAQLEVRAFGSALCIRVRGNNSTTTTDELARSVGFRTEPAGALLGQVGWMVACYGP